MHAHLLNVAAYTAGEDRCRCNAAGTNHRADIASVAGEYASPLSDYLTPCRRETGRMAAPGTHPSVLACPPERTLA